MEPKCSYLITLMLTVYISMDILLENLFINSKELCTAMTWRMELYLLQYKQVMGIVM